MDDVLEKFLTAQSEFGERMHAVREDQWQAATPCTEWTVTELARHAIEGTRMVAPLVRGHDHDAARKIVAGARSLPVDGGVGANLAEEWDEAVVEAKDAVTSDGALEQPVAFGSGNVPARQYLSILTVEFTVHGWDLAQAIGYDAAPSDGLVEFCWNQVKDMGDMFRGNEMFGDPRNAADDAPALDKLLALTGRAAD